MISSILEISKHFLNLIFCLPDKPRKRCKATYDVWEMLDRHLVNGWRVFFRIKDGLVSGFERGSLPTYENLSAQR